MRILSFCTRRIHAVEESDTVSEWNSHMIPRNESDDVQIWQVFRRNLLSSVFPTSVTVLVDYRHSRINRRYSDRVSCCSCKGIGRKRMMCAHEKTVLKLTSTETQELSEVTNVESGLGNEYWDTVMHDELTEIPMENLPVGADTQYRSRKSRNIFA